MNDLKARLPQLTLNEEKENSRREIPTGSLKGPRIKLKNYS